MVDYGIWLAILGFICSLVGQYGLNRMVKKYDRHSFVVLVIAGVIAISTFLLITIGVMNIISDITAGESFGFSSPCFIDK